MKKRVFSVLLALVLLLCAVPLPVHAAANEITVYNWGQYISDGTDDSLDVIKAFEEETGIKVNYLTFDSNESMYTKLKTGGTTFDVIIPSDYMIAKLISEDMLEPLNFDNIPNYEYIDEAFRNQAYDPENTYSVPYTWGTVGLIYNKNYVSDEDAESWSCLWNSKYQGKLLMFDNPRDAFAIAESMLGYSFNTEDEQELKNCADLLATQSPVLQGYVMDQIFDRMERGEAWAAPYYAGDYLTMVEENPDLGFSHPKEGFNIFIDAMCIPKGCQNKEGAEAFINFLCRPDISAANLDYIGYSTPETAAKDYLDEEVTSSPVSYPDDETLARSESFAELGVEATQVMNDLWLSVKTSTSNTTLYLILTIAAIAAVILFFVISGIVRRRKKHAAAASGSRHKNNFGQQLRCWPFLLQAVFYGPVRSSTSPETVSAVMAQSLSPLERKPSVSRSPLTVLRSSVYRQLPSGSVRRRSPLTLLKLTSSGAAVQLMRASPETVSQSISLPSAGSAVREISPLTVPKS